MGPNFNVDEPLPVSVVLVLVSSLPDVTLFCAPQACFEEQAICSCRFQAYKNDVQSVTSKLDEKVAKLRFSLYQVQNTSSA